MTKAVFLGDTAVGKTALINRMATGSFYENKPTISSQYVPIDVETDNQCFTIQLWDTAGQEQFRSITRQYLRNSQIVLLCYANESQSSFDSLQQWYNTIQEILDTEYSLFIVCCKCDLQPAVLKSNAEALAQSWGAQFIETSSRTGQNVEELKRLLGQCASKMDSPKVPEIQRKQDKNCC